MSTDKRTRNGQTQTKILAYLEDLKNETPSTVRIQIECGLTHDQTVNALRRLLRKGSVLCDKQRTPYRWQFVTASMFVESVDPDVKNSTPVSDTSN